jgi:hypothetical protein
MSIVDTDGVLVARDIEDKAGIESLEQLHSLRRQLLPEYKTLKALHGPFGKWDFRRKARLEAAKIQARIDVSKTGEKYTEAMIDTMGHADAGYIQFIEDGIDGATRYVEVETEMNELAERVESRIAELYAWGKEAGLAR